MNDAMCLSCGDPKDDRGLCPCDDPISEEAHELRMALEAMMGAFDTPISRRRISGDFAQEARRMGRAALSHK